ncbi:MAG: hypothetical protein WAU86_09735 [Oricola sp.]
MTRFRILFSLLLPAFLAACETSGYQPSTTSSPARQTSFRCSNDVSLVVRRAGPMVTVTDSRGIEATIPASPPGQSTRYAEGIYALILEGGNATWFVSGQVPVECGR